MGEPLMPWTGFVECNMSIIAPRSGWSQVAGVRGITHLDLSDNAIVVRTW